MECSQAGAEQRGHGAGTRTGTSGRTRRRRAGSREGRRGYLTPAMRTPTTSRRPTG